MAVVLDLLVNLSELIQASSEMNQAMELYEEAVDAAKGAADDLASKWAGAARDAFVAHQENAYQWHRGIIDVVLQMIDVIRKVKEIYERTEAEVMNIVKD